MKYNVMKYDVMKYGVMTYGVMIYDVPNIIQKSFCTPDEAMDPMNYVPAF